MCTCVRLPLVSVFIWASLLPFHPVSIPFIVIVMVTQRVAGEPEHLLGNAAACGAAGLVRNYFLTDQFSYVCHGGRILKYSQASTDSVAA